MADGSPSRHQLSSHELLTVSGHLGRQQVPGLTPMPLRPAGRDSEGVGRAGHGREHA